MNKVIWFWFSHLLNLHLSYCTLPGPVLDLSGQDMQKLDPSFMCSEDTHTLILDRNHIMKLDHLERSPALQQVITRKMDDGFA